MKKIISIMLVGCIMSTFLTPVMASTNVAQSKIVSINSTSADKGLESAIKYVKSKLNIPEDFKKFSYNIYDRDDVRVWNLEWSNETTQKTISVNVDEDNFINNYYSYQYNGDYGNKRIPKFSKEQCQEIAEKFVKNLDSNLMKQFKLSPISDNGSDREYVYTYTRQVNGINYQDNSLTVSVNNNTGAVTNYNCNFSKKTTFENASKVISLEQAKKAFSDKLGLKLVYKYKTENEKTEPYLAYIPKFTNKYIDAITGEVETYDSRYGIYNYGLMDKGAKETASSAPKTNLTPEEIKAVDGISKLITKEDADKKVRAISLFKLDGFKLQNTDLSKDWRNKDSFLWNLSYSKVIDSSTNRTRDFSIVIDAKTGEINNFWTYYNSPEGTKAQKSKDQAKAICEDALKTLIPNTFTKIKFDDSYYSYDDKNQNQFSFRYVRVENGLECPSDGVTVSYDNLSGNITNMDVNWTQNISFKDAKNVISIDKANEILFNKIGFEIEYINDYSETTSDSISAKIVPEKQNADKAVLGFLVNTVKPNVIDAVTGDILDYSGEVYKETKISNYTDIKGSACANQIKILTQLSIKYLQNELKSNDQLLQKDYFWVLSKMNDSYYINDNQSDEKNIEQMYNELINQGIITKEEKAPNSSLTREEAAKFFVKFLRLGQVAEIKDIYKSNFKDAAQVNPNLLGYVCIASGLKAVKGNNGYFMPKQKITREQGLMIIYNYLSEKK